MSFDHITPVQHSESVRLQRAQPVVQHQPTNVAQQVQENTAPERHVAAASGQELPLDQAEERASVQQVESAVSKISDFVQNFQRDLQFSVDKDSDRLVVKVVDSETQEVIRQIPSEEMLRIARSLDSSESLILREQA
ncbi:flagellar protein FlaG [Pseudomonadota bacterium]